MRRLELNGVVIDDDSDCYVIAEIGNNHQGEVKKCKQLFLAVKEAGADAVKLQKRDNRSLFTRAMYAQPYMSENAFGETYGAHREFLEFDRDEYVELCRFAKEIGLTFFATAFDVPSADFLEDLDMPAYKIASGDLKSLPLLRHVASFGKPIVLSTGGGTLEDVRRAYDAIRPINDKLAILQCTASYPCEAFASSKSSAGSFPMSWSVCRTITTASPCR
jgi:N-acetylneuraminate synthase/sialic acid synthase